MTTKTVAILSLVISMIGVAPALADAPVPPERPGAQFGEMLVSIGPGVNVDASGIDVNCGVENAAVNVIVDDNTRATIPVNCS